MTEYEKLVHILQDNSDQKYNDFNRKIINSGVVTIGCTTPFVRKIAKNYSLEQVLKFPLHEYYEVDLLRGIVISYSKIPYEQKKDLLDDFAATIENWAVCDCNCIKVSNKERELYFEYFCKLLSDERTFVCRYGVVNLLANYLDEEYICRIFTSLRSVRIWGEYYVDVAVAWLIATAVVKCRDATVKYMENEGREVLNNFAYNRALQKMRDSFRVSDEDKQWTRSLKR